MSFVLFEVKLYDQILFYRKIFKTKKTLNEKNSHSIDSACISQYFKHFFSFLVKILANRYFEKTTLEKHVDMQKFFSKTQRCEVFQVFVWKLLMGQDKKQDLQGK